MLRNRNIRRSIRDHVASVLESGMYGLPAYNVYSEATMRSGASVTSPHVYLTDIAIMPTATALPLVMIEVARIRKAPFEIGNREGRYLQVFLHVFGRNRGERDDLASLLQDNIGQSIDICDYSSGSAVVDGTSIEIGPEIDQWDAPVASDSLREEASLLNMSIVSFYGVTTQ